MTTASSLSKPLVPADIRPERALVRVATAYAAAAARGPGYSPYQQLLGMFPRDQVARALCQRAASAPATIGQTGWADVLAITAVSAFIRDLRDSAAAVLINAGVRLNLTGAGRVSLPRVSSRGVAGWVTEGSVIAVAQGVTTSGALIRPYKIGLIESLSRESLEHSQPGGAESWMEVVLRDVARATLDSSLFSSTAESGARPPGLVAGITPLTASTSTESISAATADFRALVDSIVTNQGSSAVLFFCSPGRALAAKSLLPAIAPQIHGSAFISSAELFAACPETFCSAFDPDPEITASAQVDLHFEDTTPVDIGTVGTPDIVAAPSKSMFQTDSIAFRMILKAAWGLRIPNTAAWIQTGMTW
jgi:hypothetical protein